MAVSFKRMFQKNVGGGVDRDKLADSDFAIPGERKFPVVKPRDVQDAVSSWGRYRGDTSFDTFKANLIKLAKRKGEEFVKQLPASWEVETKEWDGATADLAIGFAVFKQAKDGKYRWIMLSSNAYRDRDGEIVSTKALEDDCARADKDGFYGPLRFWHDGEPFGPGTDLGDCDFNAVSGRVLIESGTFKDERIGECVTKKADSYQGSIGFVHPRDEPDSEGVFNNIRRFERSLVPIGRAANPFTRLVVQQQEDITVKAEKEAELKSLLNGDKSLIDRVLGWARGTEKQADAMGIAFKGENEQEQESAPFSELQAAADAAVSEKADGDMAEEMMEDAAEMDETEDEEAAEDEVYVGDMTLDDLATALDMILEDKLAPIIAALDTSAKMAGMVNDMSDMYGKHGAMLEEIKSVMGGMMKTKDDESVVRETQVASLQSQIDATKTELTTTKAAVQESEVARVKQITQLETMLKEVGAQLAELKGETPSGIKPFIASQASSTVLKENDERLKTAPKDDPMSPFMQALEKMNGSV